MSHNWPMVEPMTQLGEEAEGTRGPSEVRALATSGALLYLTAGAGLGRDEIHYWPRVSCRRRPKNDENSPRRRRPQPPISTGPARAGWLRKVASVWVRRSNGRKLQINSLCCRRHAQISPTRLGPLYRAGRAADTFAVCAIKLCFINNKTDENSIAARR